MLIIRMLPSPCYELHYPNGEPVDTGDFIPHYESEDKARTEGAIYTIDRGTCGPPVPQKRPSACVSVQCNGCDSLVGEDDWVSHFGEAQEALDYARESDWQVTDEALWCPYCVIEREPGGVQVPVS